MMPNSRVLWFVVADSEKARLLRGAPTTQGSLHVDEQASLASTFSPGEHQRPDRLGAHGRSTGTSHEHEEKLAHFARELSPWLQQLLTTHAIPTCRLFAPSHMLGALRKVANKALAGKLQEHDLELAGLSPAQLAAHPRIRDLLAS